MRKLILTIAIIDLFVMVVYVVLMALYLIIVGKTDIDMPVFRYTFAGMFAVFLLCAIGMAFIKRNSIFSEVEKLMKYFDEKF